MRAVTISQLRHSIKTANEALFPHRVRLLEENNRLLTAKSSEQELEFGKKSLDISRLEGANNAGSQVQDALGVAWLLASLRDDMRDGKDKALLNEQLSHYLADARNSAERAHPYVSSLFAESTTPGVAVDIGKLRDAVGVVIADLRQCTPPAGSACRRSFDKPSGIGRNC